MDRWEYLYTKSYSIRHHVAEYYLDDIDVVVDIGTYKRKIKTDKVLYCIDPLKTFEDTFHGSVADWYSMYSNELHGKRIATIILGLHIEGEEKEFDCVVDLIKKSSIIVIEFAKQHAISQHQFDTILSRTGFIVENEISFKMPIVETPGHPPFRDRTLYTLKEKNVNSR